MALTLFLTITLKELLKYNYTI